MYHTCIDPIIEPAVAHTSTITCLCITCTYLASYSSFGNIVLTLSQTVREIKRLVLESWLGNNGDGVHEVAREV